MNQDLKRTIILENYQNPTNRGLIDDDSYSQVVQNSVQKLEEQGYTITKFKNYWDDDVTIELRYFPTKKQAKKFAKDKGYVNYQID